MIEGFAAFFLVYVMEQAVMKVLAIWQVLVLGSDVSFFCLQIKIKIFNSIKNNMVLSLCRKSLRCLAGILH